jgi:hypothetical protein
MKRKWNFLSNSFEVSTRRNYKKMLVMITYHADMMRTLKDSFHPGIVKETCLVKDAYGAAYNNHTLVKAGRKGDTNTFKKMLKELYTERLPRWEGHVLIRFPENTREYRILFTKGRTGFRGGQYYDRIERIRDFAVKLNNFPGLFALRLEVEEFHDKLHDLWKASVGNSSSVKNASQELEAARKAAATCMYANLGLLMHKYSHDPSLIVKYFEVSKLRQQRKKKTEAKPAVRKAVRVRKPVALFPMVADVKRQPVPAF